jgi:hypothetical protein
MNAGSYSPYDLFAELGRSDDAAAKMKAWSQTNFEKRFAFI